MKAEGLISFQGLPLEGPLLLKPKVFSDARGFFFESWNKDVLNELLAGFGKDSEVFVQDNHSRSDRGVLRGLHFQTPPHEQAKLVRCISGEILDVAVDIRKNSPTFKYWTSEVLSYSNCKQLFIPEGFAHGFLVLSAFAEVVYECSNIYYPKYDSGIIWNDPEIAIDWGIDNPILSKKDESLPKLIDIKHE